MNLHNEWMTDNNLFGDDYLNKLQIQQAKERFELQKNSNEGKDATIDGISERVVTQVHLNSVDSNKDYTKLHTSLESNVHTGSIVKINNVDYIVVDNVTDNGAYKSTEIQKSNNILKFYNKIGISWVLQSVPCIISSPFKTNMGYDELGKLIQVFSKDYQVIIPDNSSTKSIIEGVRFILKDPISSENDEIYKVEGKDKWSVNGLKTLKFSVTEFSSDDNRELGIANYYSHQNIYEVVVLNGTLIKKYFGDEPFQLDISCKENGEIVSEPDVTYISEDEKVCTVSSTGLITLAGTGTTNVKVIFGTAEGIVQIQSNIVSQDNYNIILTPSDSTIKANRSLKLTANVTNNGINDPLKQVGFEITNVDGSSNQYVTYVINNNSIIITAGSSYNKFINLKVYMLAYHDVYIERQIKIVSLI